MATYARNCRKSPTYLRNIPIFGRLCAETNFDLQCVIDDGVPFGLQSRKLSHKIGTYCEGDSSLTPFVLEARYKRSDGEWRWLRSESQPRWDPTGKHIGFIGVAHAITPAKAAETDLRAPNEPRAQPL